MEELQKEKELLKAIRSAIANMNLEEDFDINLDNFNIKELEEKVLKIGGNDNVKLGGLFCR